MQIIVVGEPVNMQIIPLHHLVTSSNFLSMLLLLFVVVHCSLLKHYAPGLYLSKKKSRSSREDSKLEGSVQNYRNVSETKGRTKVPLPSLSVWERMLLKQKIECTATEETLFRVRSVTPSKPDTHEKVLYQTSALGEAEISLTKSNYSSHLALLCLICKVTSVNYLPSVAQTSVLNGPVDSS